MALIPESWIPHRRADGESIGWIDITTAAPKVIPIDRLGREREPVDDWVDAEEVLEEIGLGFLTHSFFYSDMAVRIRHIDDQSVIVTTALTDAIGDYGEEFRLDFPPGDALLDF